MLIKMNQIAPHPEFSLAIYRQVIAIFPNCIVKFLFCVKCRDFYRNCPPQVLEQLISEARAEGNCYKIILDCTEGNSVVYEKIGFFKTGEIQMRNNL